MENLTESQIKRKIDTLKRALEDKNVPEVAHPKMKEDLKKFEKMLKDFEKKAEKEAEKDIKKVDDIADLDLPELDLDEDTTTEPKKKRGRPKGSTNKKGKATRKTKEYTLTVDGKKFTFKDKASKDVCSKAVEYAKAKKEQQATASKKYASKSVGAKISNNLQTIARQAVSKAKQRKVAPAVLKKQVDAVEKAFNSLFSALQTLTGVTISQAQKNAIMRILTDFEKTQTTSTTKSTQVKKKEMGGTVDSWEDVDPDVLYGKGGAISVGEKVRINDSGEVMTVKDISKNSKNQVEFSGSKGTFLIGDIEKMEQGGGIMADGRLVLREFNGIGGNKNKTYKLIKDDRDSDGKPYYSLVEYPSNNVMAQGDSFKEVNEVANMFSGRYADGGEVKKRSERDSIRIYNAWMEYYKAPNSNATVKYNKFQKVVEETQIPKDKLQKITDYAMSRPKSEHRHIDIYQYWDKSGSKYAEGGEVQEPKNSWDWQSFL